MVNVLMHISAFFSFKFPVRKLYLNVVFEDEDTLVELRHKIKDIYFG